MVKILSNLSLLFRFSAQLTILLQSVLFIYDEPDDVWLDYSVFSNEKNVFFLQNDSVFCNWQVQGLINNSWILSEM
jgi:hypothetical protein